ncbi:MAG: hypothetical protein U5M23_14030 [Marinagarivorans sp.]|nr:hypothetical protein [Marinagarivorans sp.]
MHSLRRQVLTLLLMTTFMVQSMVAVAMPCKMMGANSTPAISQPAPTPNTAEHSGMSHCKQHAQNTLKQIQKTDNKTTQANHDCCKTMGHCGGGALPALGYKFTLNIAPASSGIAIYYTRNPLSTPLSSLYRPPIIA